LCNLYSVTAARQSVLRLFKVGDNRAAAFEPLPAIFPGWTAPVVRRTTDGDRELVLMRWGFIRLQPGRAPRPVTNTRDDNLSSQFWWPSFEARRCLVPATSFCEPNDGRAKGEKATWHWFALRGGEPRPLFAFAGIWHRWRGPIKKDGPNVETDVYSFMTTVPNDLTISINHERSPVLLTTEAERETWLTGTPAQAEALLRPIAAERLRIVQEGFDKEDLLAS
jgi:putative SOS response-associated peptidase YedK